MGCMNLLIIPWGSVSECLGWIPPATTRQITLTQKIFYSFAQCSFTESE